MSSITAIVIPLVEELLKGYNKSEDFTPANSVLISFVKFLHYHQDLSDGLHAAEETICELEEKVDNLQDKLQRSRSARDAQIAALSTRIGELNQKCQDQALELTLHRNQAERSSATRRKK